MAAEGCGCRVLWFCIVSFIISVYAVTSILLLQSNTKHNKLSNETITLREKVAQLNRVVSQLKAELDGPHGCIAQVRGVVLVVYR